MFAEYENEIWKTIEQYPDYQVSNLGRVRSFKKGKIYIKSIAHYPNGYCYVNLYENGHQHACLVHRLVAKAFIPNPDNLPQVNHKDENKDNNAVDNLEWCTEDYNRHYGTGIQRMGMAHRCMPKTSKKVYSVDEQGNVEYYGSLGEAGRQMGVPWITIHDALRRRDPYFAGKRWYYYKDDSEKKIACG